MLTMTVVLNPSSPYPLSTTRHQRLLNGISALRLPGTAATQTLILPICALAVDKAMEEAQDVVRLVALADRVATWTRCFASRCVVSGMFIELSCLCLSQCGEKGHYANHCRNRNVPGNRGGVERAPKRYDEQ